MGAGSMVFLAILLCGGVALAEGERRDGLGDPLPAQAVQRLGTLRLRYGGVSGLAYLADGSAVILNGGYIDIWAMSKGERLSQTKVSQAGLVSVQVRSDGKTLLLGDSAGKVREWAVERKAEVRSWDSGQKELRTACYSPDEKRVLTAANSPPGLKEWDLVTGKELISIKSEMVDIRAGAIYGPNGKTAILGGGYEHNLEHYDLATGRLLKKWCTVYEAKHMALSPDQKYVTVGLEDRAVEWSLENYTKLHDYKHCPGEAARIFWVAYLPATNEVLCGGRDGTIHRWNRTTGERAFSWTPHQSTVAPLCVSPDQKWVLSYGTGLVAETNIATGEPRVKWERHNGSIQAVAFVPSGRQVVSASSDATLRVWDVVSGKTIQVIKGASLGAYAVAVSPDGTRVAAGCKDGKVREFAVSDGKLLRELAGHLGYVRAVKYTHKGDRLLSSADDGSIRIWGPDRNEEIARLEGHRGGVLGLDISPDDKYVVSCGRDATVRVWDLVAGKLLRTMQGHRGWVECVTFTPDGRHVLSAGRDKRILEWDLDAGKLVSEIPPAWFWVRALACSPDGSQVFSAGDGGEILRWDLRTGQKAGILKGHAGTVSGLAVSPDGRRLVSGSQDTTLLVWQLD